MLRGRITFILSLSLMLSGCSLAPNPPVSEVAESARPSSSATATKTATPEPKSQPSVSSTPEQSATLSDLVQEQSAGNTLELLLSELEIEPELRDGYDRDLFRHWIDEDSDGCNTRREVLLLESLVEPEISGNCQVAGVWFSVYDQFESADPSEFDIDHVVALAEAWDSGASEWDNQRRRAFANDLGFDGSLIAVSASSNRSKSDQDPAQWLPLNAEYHCEYAFNWMAVKYRWQLSIDSSEALALADLVAVCPSLQLIIPERY